MIYKFQIISQESQNFKLEVALDASHSFFNLHSIIQKSVGYESHQLASFFISNEYRKKLVEVSMLDLGINGGVYHIMQKTKLQDLLHSKQQQLIYTFDFINDRSFLIELIEITMDKNLNEPTVALKKGDAPMQVLGGTESGYETDVLQEEEVFMDFGELEDYTEIFGEMDDI